MEFKVVVILSFLLCTFNDNVFVPSTQCSVEANKKETEITFIQSDINVLKDNMHELLKRVLSNENEISLIKRENLYLTNELENKRRQFSCEINVFHENTNEHQRALININTEINHLNQTIDELRNSVDKLEELQRRRSHDNIRECIDKSVTPCSSSPCLNGGICTLTGSSYNCTCLPGYIGYLCQVQTSCNNGWKRYANDCYYFSTTSATWYDAKRECLEQNSRLADATSISEIKFLRTNAEKYGKNFWLDGTDESEEGVWVRATSEQKFTVTDWHRRTSSEPNNEKDNEHCLNIHKDLDYQWNDAGCSNRFRYICKNPLM